MAGAFWLKACYRARFLLLAAGYTLGSVPAFAGDWSQSISVPMTLEADSNPTLVSSNSAVLRRARIVPDYKLTGTFGADELWTNLALQIERSSDRNISLPREDPSLLLGWRHHTQTGEFGLVTKHQEASTRVTELDESGLVVRDGTRKTQSLAGNWRSAISERSSLAANADYTAVAYDSGTLTSYNNTSLGLKYTNAWSERTEPFLRLAASHYKPDGTAVAASDNTTLAAGVQSKASESLDWTAEVGRSRISGATSASRWLGSFVLRHAGERHAATLEAGRSIGASGVGGFVESDWVKASWTYTINARARAGLEASRRDSKGLLPNTMNQVGVWATQELSPFWSTRLSYQYRQLQQSGFAAASSHLLGVSLIYTHLDF